MSSLTLSLLVIKMGVIIVPAPQGCWENQMKPEIIKQPVYVKDVNPAYVYLGKGDLSRVAQVVSGRAPSPSVCPAALHSTRPCPHTSQDGPLSGHCLHMSDTSMPHRYPLPAMPLRIFLLFYLPSKSKLRSRPRQPVHEPSSPTWVFC